MKTKKNIQTKCIKTYCKEKHVYLLLTEEEGKRQYVLIKDFSTFLYDHTPNLGRRHFCRCCLQAFSTEEILKDHVKECFKLKANKN